MLWKVRGLLTDEVVLGESREAGLVPKELRTRNRDASPEPVRLGW